jgi:hypothetical protein
MNINTFLKEVMMSNKQNNLVWGVVLFILAGLFLVESLDLIPDFSQAMWMAVLGAVCLFFVVVDFLNGKGNWRWLFPIFITVGLILSAVLSLTTITPIWIGAILMVCISTPFWIVFLFDNKKNWWALLPAWATVALALIISVSEIWTRPMVGALVIWSVALPFIVIFFRYRIHWWATIPGFFVILAGTMVLLVNHSPEETIGTFVLLVLAFPFFAIYFFARNWWAIIPAGILTTLALLVPFAIGVEDNNQQAQLLSVAMFLGFSIPFAWLWWRRNLFPTAWTKYPVAGLIVAAIITLVPGTVIQSGWLVFVIVIVAWLLYDNLRQPKLSP